MRPLNNRGGEKYGRRHAAGVAARASLSVACLLAVALDLRAEAAPGRAGMTALREKDVRRAEKVLAKLRRLDEAAAAGGGGAKTYHALAADFYPGLFVTVADMRESDLKTDLDTAAFLYAKAARTWFAADALAADCDRERRDIYLPLCLALRRGTVRQLLLSKARLHAGWAAALVKDYRVRGTPKPPARWRP